MNCQKCQIETLEKMCKDLERPSSANHNQKQEDQASISDYVKNMKQDYKDPFLKTQLKLGRIVSSFRQSHQRR